MGGEITFSGCVAPHLSESSCGGVVAVNGHKRAFFGGDVVIKPSEILVDGVFFMKRRKGDLIAIRGYVRSLEAIADARVSVI